MDFSKSVHEAGVSVYQGALITTITSTVSHFKGYADVGYVYLDATPAGSSKARVLVSGVVSVMCVGAILKGQLVYVIDTNENAGKVTATKSNNQLGVALCDSYDGLVVIAISPACVTGGGSSSTEDPMSKLDNVTSYARGDILQSARNVYKTAEFTIEEGVEQPYKGYAGGSVKGVLTTNATNISSTTWRGTFITQGVVAMTKGFTGSLPFGSDLYIDKRALACGFDSSVKASPNPCQEPMKIGRLVSPTSGNYVWVLLDFDDCYHNPFTESDVLTSTHYYIASPDNTIEKDITYSVETWPDFQFLDIVPAKHAVCIDIDPYAETPTWTAIHSGVVFIPFIDFVTTTNCPVGTDIYVDANRTYTHVASPFPNVHSDYFADLEAPIRMGYTVTPVFTYGNMYGAFVRLTWDEQDKATYIRDDNYLSDTTAITIGRHRKDYPALLFEADPEIYYASNAGYIYYLKRSVLVLASAANGSPKGWSSTSTTTTYLQCKGIVSVHCVDEMVSVGTPLYVAPDSSPIPYVTTQTGGGDYKRCGYAASAYFNQSSGCNIWMIIDFE